MIEQKQKNTPRIRLRALHKSDKQAVIQLLGNVQVMHFLGPRRALSVIEVKQWLS